MGASNCTRLFPCSGYGEDSFKRGADPNKTAFSHEDRSVWALFLIPCLESVERNEATDFSRRTWYKVSEILVEHGARRNRFKIRVPRELRDVEVVLEKVFPKDKATKLLNRMDEFGETEV